MYEGKLIIMQHANVLRYLIGQHAKSRLWENYYSLFNEQEQEWDDNDGEFLRSPKNLWSKVGKWVEKKQEKSYKLFSPSLLLSLYTIATHYLLRHIIHTRQYYNDPGFDKICI